MVKLCQSYRYSYIILFSHRKERNLAIYNNIDGTWGHYAKWNKSDRERQIPYDLTYMWNLKTKTIKTIKQAHRYREQENRLVVDRGEG